MWPRLYSMRRRRWNEEAASLTPTRRTPHAEHRRQEFLRHQEVAHPTRSRVISNQRASRASSR